MIKLTITALGTPKQYQGAKGPYERNYLKAKEYNDKFLNFYVNKTTSQWKIGQEIEVEAVEEKQYTSKKDGSLQTSFDIKLPKYGNNGDVMKKLEELLGDNLKTRLEVRQMLEKFYEAIVKLLDKGEKDPTFDVEAQTGLKKGETHPFDDAGLEHINEDEFQGM